MRVGELGGSGGRWAPGGPGGPATAHSGWVQEAPSPVRGIPLGDSRPSSPRDTAHAQAGRRPQPVAGEGGRGAALPGPPLGDGLPKGRGGLQIRASSPAAAQGRREMERSPRTLPSAQSGKRR